MTSPVEAGGSEAPARTPASTRAPARAGERRREQLTFWAYRALERLIAILPRRLVLKFAMVAGNATYDVAGSKQEIVAGNLARALGVPVGDPRAGRAARQAFRSYGKYLADVLRMSSLAPAEMARLVDIDNLEILDEARGHGAGVLICTVHIGGMDIIGPALAGHGEKLHVIADDTTYGRLYDHLKAVRAEHGLLLIGWRNLRGIFRVLRDRENLVLFCDGGFRRGDVPVEFLGEPTTFPSGPASLSARTGAPMLPVYCRRQPDDRFRARGLPLIRCASDDPGEVYRATQALADELGSVIAGNPEQWYMFRPVWPQSDDDRAWAASALAAARRGEPWERVAE